MLKSTLKVEAKLKIYIFYEKNLKTLVVRQNVYEELKI